jgi:heme exporter protein A
VLDTTSNAQPVYELDGLSCLRDEQALFAPIGLRLFEGELVLIEGDNGVGKTTLLRALLGLRPLAFDTFKSASACGDQALVQFQHQSAWLGHAAAMKASLSVWQNWQFAASLHNAAITREQALTLGKRVALAGFEDLAFGALSAGQKKRAQLACLVLSKRQIWLMDEPFANLDLAGIALVESELKQHLLSGGIALATSHGVLPFQIPHRTVHLKMATW